MSKSVQKTFLDDEQNRLLELFYELSEEYLTVKNKVDKIESKKQKEKEITAIKTKVHKVHKDLIKLMVKISVLSRHVQNLTYTYVYYFLKEVRIAPENSLLFNQNLNMGFFC